MKKMPEKTVGRRRDAATTRTEILNAAIRLFAERSYEDVGLREIVGAVGVDAALVKRYFGSKEGLFAEVLEWTNKTIRDSRELYAGNRAEVAARLARFVTDANGELFQANLLSLGVRLRANHSRHTADMMRKNMEKEVIHPLAEWMGGTCSIERASLMSAYLIGLGTMQRLMKFDPFNKGNMDVITRYVESALQTCIDGTLHETPGNAGKKAPKAMAKTPPQKKALPAARKSR